MSCCKARVKPFILSTFGSIAVSNDMERGHVRL